MRNDYYDQCGENGEFLSIHDAVLWCKEQLQVHFKYGNYWLEKFIKTNNLLKTKLLVVNSRNFYTKKNKIYVNFKEYFNFN